MSTFRGLLIAVVAAASVGLGLTAWSIERGRGASSVRIGAWTAEPRAGTAEADPYTRAVNARLGSFPLAAADGFELIAEVDTSGRKLDGRCKAVLSADLPPARFWTLTLYDESWAVLEGEVGRVNLTSYEIVRDAQGQFTISVAPTAQPGNWLPSGGLQQYRLVLRLYDTSAVNSLTSRDRVPVPLIRQEGC